MHLDARSDDRLKASNSVTGRCGDVLAIVALSESEALAAVENDCVRILPEVIDRAMWHAMTAKLCTVTHAMRSTSVIMIVSVCVVCLYCLGTSHSNL